jgi:predicted O-methyltransferase YrrM
VVEIGSAWGRSSVFLAAGCRDSSREGLIAIDPHTGDDWFLADAGIGRVNSYDEFRSNLRRFEVADWVEPLVMTSDEAAATVPSQPIRLLFIDGSHTYEAVSRDIHNWVPRLVDGGVVVFDDYPNPDPTVGVRQAVDDLLASGLVEPTLRRGFNLVWTRKRRLQSAVT